jgi:hypothetical protein
VVHVVRDDPGDERFIAGVPAEFLRTVERHVVADARAPPSQSASVAKTNDCQKRIDLNLAAALFSVSPAPLRESYRAWALVSRPVPGQVEVAKLTHQLGPERAERAALRDCVPPAVLADTPPPRAALARGDLSHLASPERAQAPHAPHRTVRFI